MLLRRLGELVFKGAVDRLGLLPCRKNNFGALTILSQPANLKKDLVDMFLKILEGQTFESNYSFVPISHSSWDIIHI